VRLVHGIRPRVGGRGKGLYDGIGTSRGMNAKTEKGNQHVDTGGTNQGRKYGRRISTGPNVGRNGSVGLQ